MKIKGKVISVQIGQMVGAHMLYNKLANETSATLNVSQYVVNGVGEKRGTEYRLTKKTWSVSAQMLLNSEQAEKLVVSMKNKQSLSIKFATSETETYSGNAILTSLSYAAQGNGIVRMQTEWQGNGPLSKGN